METVQVNVEDMAGKKFKASLPYDAPVSRLLPLLITKMGLSQNNASGRRLSYRLMHVESGLQLRDNDTLRQADVQPGHTLKLLADLVAGHGVAITAFNISQDGFFTTCGGRT